MLNSAVFLLRERGAAGVTVDAVLAHSGAPRGSVYHHFPGGRNELILGAARLSGDFITAMVDEATRDGDAQQVMARFIAFWKHSLTSTDYRAGCPVVALAVDSREDIPDAATLVREIFTQWQTRLADLLTADGFPAERAGRLATLIVAAVEGAIILARARRDLSALDDIHTEIAPLLGAP